MLRRNGGHSRRVSLRLAAGAIAVMLAGCSTAPYRIEAATNPPWELFRARDLPVLDPPLSERAHRLELCYGAAVNSEEDILALAEELCGSGRLVLEDQNTFWNGCSILQPTRVTYICDPPEEAATKK
jgi:hypothetical protein